MTVAPTTYPTPIDDAVTAIGLLRDFMLHSPIYQEPGRSENGIPSFSRAWNLTEELLGGNIPPHLREDLFERASEIVAAFHSEVQNRRPRIARGPEEERSFKEARLLAQQLEGVTSIDVVPNIISSINGELGSVNHLMLFMMTRKPWKNSQFLEDAWVTFVNSRTRAASAIPNPEWEANEARFWSNSGQMIELQNGERATVEGLFRELTPVVLLAGVCETLRKRLVDGDRAAGIERMVAGTSKVENTGLHTPKRHRRRNEELNEVLIAALDGVLEQLPEGQAMFARLGDITFAHENAR